MATEHHVQAVFRQFVDLGDTVFDVGANKGWLAAPLARLVGRAGRVICFEPSPRNLPDLEAVANSHPQVKIVKKGVYHTDNQTLRFYENPFSNADSIYFSGEGSIETIITTTTLDQYVAESGDIPKFIKMDIEGAEYDALVGAKSLIKKHKPILCLEMRKQDLRPMELLLKAGYSAYNARTFEKMGNDESLFLGELEDVLFVPKAAFGADRGLPFGQKPSRQETPIRNDKGSIVASLVVHPGINLIMIEISSPVERELYDIHALMDGRCIAYMRGSGAMVLKPSLELVVPSGKLSKVDVVISSVSQIEVAVKAVESKLIQMGAANLTRLIATESRDPFGFEMQVLSSDLDAAAGQGQLNRLLTYLKHFPAENLAKGRTDYLLGVAKLRVGLHNEAVSHLNSGLKQGFDEYWSCYMLGIASLELGDKKSASRFAARAIKANQSGQEAKDLNNSIQI